MVIAWPFLFKGAYLNPLIVAYHPCSKPILLYPYVIFTQLLAIVTEKWTKAQTMQNNILVIIMVPLIDWHWTGLRLAHTIASIWLGIKYELNSRPWYNTNHCNSLDSLIKSLTRPVVATTAATTPNSTVNTVLNNILLYWLAVKLLLELAVCRPMDSLLPNVVVLFCTVHVCCKHFIWALCVSMELRWKIIMLYLAGSKQLVILLMYTSSAKPTNYM